MILFQFQKLLPMKTWEKTIAFTDTDLANLKNTGIEEFLH